MICQGCGQEVEPNEIAEEYKRLSERRIQYISWAIPFKDPKANAKMEVAEKDFDDYAKIEWVTVPNKKSEAEK